MKRMSIAPAFLSALMLIFSGLPVFAAGYQEAPPRSGAAGTGFPLTVADDSGVELTIESPPQRIVSLTAFTDDVLVDLVDHDRIAAVTAFAEDADISNVADRVADIEQKITLNVEVVLSLDPDLVFVANWSDPDKVTQLRNAGLTVFLLATPLTVDEIAAKIESVAAMVGEPARGKEIVDDMRKAIADVERRIGGIPKEQRKTVIDYAVWGTAQGAGTSWQEIIDHAGLVNAVADLEVNEWGQVPLSKEKLIELDPDLVVLPGWVYGDPNGAGEFYKQVVNDPALKGLSAIKAGMAIQMPERLKTTTSQYIADSIRFLAEHAYPEHFK